MYDVRVYESNGLTRWSRDFMADFTSIVSNPLAFVYKRVATALGRVFVVGPRLVDANGDHWSMIIYDEEDGGIIQKVDIGLALLDVAVNGTPPLFSDATHVFVLAAGANQFVYRLSLDGATVDSYEIDNDIFVVDRLSMRADNLILWGCTNLVGDEFYGGGAWAGFSAPRPRFGADQAALLCFNSPGLTFYTLNTDGSERWHANSTQAVDPYLPVAPNDAAGDSSGIVYIAHPSFTRLVGGDLPGLAGVSNTGGLSRWSNTGLCAWMTGNARITVVLTTDGALMTGGGVGGAHTVEKFNTSGVTQWAHNHLLVQDSEPLPDGAAVFTGARRNKLADQSFV